MISSRVRTHVIVVVTSVCLTACGGQAPATQKASKGVVTKSGGPDFQPEPELDRAALKIASKPRGGRVAVVKATAPAPTQITASRPVNGSLSRSDEKLDDGSYVDFYSYNATRGERVTITLRSTAFDAYLMTGRMRNGVFDGDLSDDDSGGNRNASLTATLEDTGPVIIAANSIDAGETGAYTLELVPAPAASTGGGGSGGGIGELPLKTPVNGRLETGDAKLTDGTFYDTWIFDGRAGQRVSITMRSEPFDAYLILKRGMPSSRTVIAEDDDTEGGTNARITTTLPEDGAYTVMANSVDPGTGAYTLVLEEAAGGGPAAPSIPYADRYPGTGDPNEKYALVVGIDDYPGTGNDLNGPVADARIFRDVLISKFGFKPANIVTLNNADATREHILNAFLRHLGQAGSQGAAVFFYSGHGTRMPGNIGLTAPLDPEADGRDEALFVWGTDRSSSIILDDEIGYLVDQLKTEKVLLIHDSCNSGTSSRGPGGGQGKAVNLADLSQPIYQPRGFFVGANGVATMPGGTPKGDNVLEARRQYGLLAGSKDEELSYTARGWPDRGGVASVFTYYLVSVLESSRDTDTFTQVMTRVRDQTIAYTQKTYKETQTPQMVGTIGTQTIGSILR